MSFLIVSVVYLISTLLLNPLGNYIVNDEWLYFRQVEAFLEGIYRINSLIDPTFILQGALGTIWSRLFGFSFSNLHILSFIFVFVFVSGLIKVLQLFKLNTKIQIFIPLVILFNPVFYHLSFTFMTELYFLTFLIWAVYFSVLSIKRATLKNLFLAGCFIAATVLIRQIGLALFLSFLVALYFEKVKGIIKYIVVSLPVALGVGAYLVWPRYTLESFNLLNKLTDFGDFYRSLPLYLVSAFYFAFFVSPVILKRKLSFSWLSPLRLLLFMIFSVVIFRMGVFPIGNILVLEGILAENEHIHYLSLFNNPVTKAFFAILLSFSLIKLVGVLNELRSKSNTIEKYLLLNFGLFYLATLVIGDFYDRYLLIPFIFLLIYLAKNIGTKSYSWVLLVFLILFSLVLEFDYLGKVKMRWDHAYELQSTTGKLLTIGVDPAYGKYFKAKKTKEYSGFVYPNPTECCSCRVIQYPIYSDQKLQDIFSEELPQGKKDTFTHTQRALYFLKEINPTIRGEMPKETNDFYVEFLANKANQMRKDKMQSVSSPIFGNHYETFSYCE